MTYLPVGQLHSRAESLVAKFEQSLRGAGYIDSAIDLDRKALELCPPDHPEQTVSLAMTSLERQGTLRKPLSWTKKHWRFTPTDTLIGRHR